MKDFRQRIVQRRPDQSEIEDLLRKGVLGKALRKARAAGVIIPQENIDATAMEMFRANRAGELVAMVGKVDVDLPFSTTQLLLRVFDAEDYHTFLKQAHRLGVGTKHETRVKEAIAVVERTAPLEAHTWRRKFGMT